MSDFERNDFRPGAPAGITWSLAAFSVAVFLCSVLGAKLLSRLVDNDQLAKSAYDRAMRDVAANAQQPQQPVPSAYSIVRSVGVDGMTTATIPLRSTPPVSPCGDEKVRGRGEK